MKLGKKMINEIALAKQTKKRRKLLLIIPLVLLIIICITTVAISTYVGWQLTHPEKRPIEDHPENYGLSYEEVEFQSRVDHINLKGWLLLPSEEPKMTIIFAHGYTANRHDKNSDVMQLLSSLTEQGFRVLTFDFRNSGESEGSLTTVGIKEQYDLLGAIDWVEEQYDDPIALLGFSMGAATSLVAGSKHDAVKAVVADSPFSDFHSYLEENLSVWSGLPNFPFTPLIITTTQLLINEDIDSLKPIDEIENKADKPILFIHGTGDKDIPFTESEKMVAVNEAMYELWLVEGAEHVKSYQENPTSYVAKVTEFFNRVIK
jgi:uncharacterized protein